jgi:redox-sensitive bicupin YhaK (pirin superfamily)
MITLRKAHDRFHTKIDWLDSWHTFSFGHHYDPKHMGFGPLRVINDDRISGGGGFPTHAHRDMEIITVVLSGALEHKDSLGTGSVIKPGDVQKMSAGSGIRHSEFNSSQTDSCHLLQIWIIPDKDGVKPAYEQIHFAPEKRRDRWCLAAAPGGAEGSISLYQDARMFIADLSVGKTLSYDALKDRNIWAHVATGKVEANGTALSEGDGLAVTGGEQLTFTGKETGTVLLFDMGQ